MLLYIEYLFLYSILLWNAQSYAFLQIIKKLHIFCTGNTRSPFIPVCQFSVYVFITLVLSWSTAVIFTWYVCAHDGYRNLINYCIKSAQKNCPVYLLKQFFFKLESFKIISKYDVFLLKKNIYRSLLIQLRYSWENTQYNGNLEIPWLIVVEQDDVSWADSDSSLGRPSACARNRTPQRPYWLTLASGLSHYLPGLTPMMISPGIFLNHGPATTFI